MYRAFDARSMNSECVFTNARAKEEVCMREREREREREVVIEICVGVCAETFLLRVRRGLKFFV